MDPLSLILNVIIAVIVVIILFLVLMEALKEFGAGGNWPRIVKLACLLLLLVWVLAIIFGRMYIVTIPH